MKIRNGFVSNSSSTSFVVSKDRKEEAISLGLKLISALELKSWLKQISDMGADFLVSELSLGWKITELSDDSYITEPYDRDRAYKEEIDFPIFEEDL